MLEAALDYWNKGYSVIPIKTRTKEPAISWKPYQSKLAKENEIRGWWSEWPYANIGIVTGKISNLTVIDLDGSQGTESFSKHLQKELPETRIHSSPNGMHLYYKYNANIKQTTGILPKVDIRNDGGYILAPPSKVNGKNYSVKNDREIATVTKIPQALIKSSAPTQAKGSTPTTNSNDWVEDLLLNGAEDGTRNDSAARLAGYFINKGLSPTVIETLMFQFASKCNPPMEKDEILSVIGSISSYSQGVPTQDDLTSDIRNNLQEVRLKIVSAADLRSDAKAGKIPKQECLLFLGADVPIFIKDRTHLLSAFPKTGKTELMCQLVPKWGKSGSKIGYVTEEPTSVWAHRLRESPFNWDNVDLLPAMGVDRIEIFLAIDKNDYDIIIIDTIRLMGLKDENNNSEISNLFSPLIALCRNKGITLILLHHTRKGGGENGEAASGGHALYGIVDSGLEILRDRKAQNRRLIRGWGRIVEVPDLIYERQDDGIMKLLGSPKDLELDTVKERLLKVLVKDIFQSTKDMREVLKDPSPSLDQVNKALNGLVKDGLVERDPPIGDGSKPGATYKWKLK